MKLAADMTDEELRVVIAEWCGAIWVRLIDAEPHRSLIMPEDDIGALPRADMSESVVQIHNVPNYVHDLNAVHSAVEKLSCDDNEASPAAQYQETYQETLWYLVNPGIAFTKSNLFDVAYLHRFLNAPANKHCIALVKTIEGMK